jgi:WD40 repeat protein
MTGASVRASALRSLQLASVLLLPSLIPAAAQAAPGDVRLLTGPVERVTSVAYSPDGKTVAVGSAEKLIRLVDASTKAVKLVVDAGGIPAARTLRWSPEGHQFVAAMESGGISAWTAAGAQAWSVKSPVRGGALSLAYASDGKSIFTGFPDGSIRVLDAHTGRFGRTISSGKAPILALATSHDGEFFATADGNVVRIWSTRTGKFLRLAKSAPEASTFISVTFSPDSRVLAGGTQSGPIRFWDVLEGNELAHIDAHLGAVRMLAYSTAGDRLVSASADRSVRFWDIQTGEKLQELAGHTQAVNDVALHPDGLEIASGGDDADACFWDVETGRMKLKLTGPKGVPTALAYVPASKNLVAFTDVGMLTSFDTTTGLPQWERAAHTPPARAMVMTPDARYLVTAGGYQMRDSDEPADVDGGPSPGLVSSGRGDLKIWETGGLPLRDLGGHAGIISAMALSGNGRYLATGAEIESRGDILLWDMAAGATILRVGAPIGPVRALAFASGANVFASGSPDGTATVFDPHTGAVKQTIQAGRDVQAVALSTEGDILATGGSSSDGPVIQLWDSQSGKLLRRLKGHHGAITSLSWSTDGWYLLSTSAPDGPTGSGEAKLWLSQTNALAASLTAPPGVGFQSATLAPDVHTIALGGTDKSIRIWNAR